jgi:hypothetical protein
VYDALVAAKTKSKQAPGAGKVIAFPPLPPVPRPPRLPPDPRQRTAAHIVGSIADMAHKTMRVAGPNFATGFHASAVDLGGVQTALGRGIARLDMGQVEARWDEVRDWMLDVLRVWVQRCKGMNFERHENGVHVELETQDDHGYYSYEFDVFPGKQSPHV